MMAKGVYIHKKGFYRSEETKKKLSERRKSEWANPDSKRNSKETRLKMGLVHKGKKLSEEQKQKMAIKRKGSLNPAWKGKEAGYVAIHCYMRRRIPKPQFCEKCGLNLSKHLANIGHKYSRNKKEWKWLCVKCHMILDNRYESFINRRR